MNTRDSLTEHVGVRASCFRMLNTGQAVGPGDQSRTFLVARKLNAQATPLCATD